MKILSLDSSTESATCAVLEDDRLLGEITFNFKKQHSVVLMAMIENLLNNLQLQVSSLDGFVVSKGPGSFTGLRIGAATIKGLSQGSQKPFVGVSSLDGLAYNMSYTSGIICPILDALRGNVYSALYELKNNQLHKITDYMIISVDELINLLKEKQQPVSFIGDGLYKFKDTLKENLQDCKFAPPHLNLARASSLGELGLSLLKNGIKDDPLSFAPFYLRKSQAEREYEKNMGCKNE